ncbi:PAS domain-containing protein, partial [Vibrio parahaemolyticus]|nr:PAS domain-containing protein [Vibrio parahaemolyticus]
HIQRMKQILDCAQIATWEWNVQTGETKFNERWAGIVGYNLQELAPTDINTWLNLAHPDDLALSEVALNAHFSGEKPYYECEARMRHKDGHWVWVRDYGRIVSWDQSGNPEWMLGTHIDISAYKHIQAQNELLSKDLNMIMDLCPTVIYKISTD